MRATLPLLALGLLLAAAVAVPVAPAAHADALPDLATLKAAALPKAVGYLRSLADQGIHDAYLVEAVEGAGLDPGLWPTPATNLVDRLEIPTVGPPDSTADPPHFDPTRSLEAYLQTGYDPNHVHGRDAVADLKAQWPQSAGGPGFASFTIFGLHAAGLPDGDPVIQNAVQALDQGQTTAGAWICPGTGPNVDCTGFALTALAAVHALLPSTGTLSKAWLDQVRNPDGGYPEQPSLNPASNTQSTIWAINGYRAIGAAEPDASWRYILGLQQPDGSFLLHAGWTDTPADYRGLPTKEIVTSLARPFNLWPVYHAATVTVSTIHADVPAPLAVGAPFTAATWAALDGSNATASGTTARLTVTQPGPLALHLDAQGGGIHHRETMRLDVVNDPPAFVSLPAAMTADRVHPFTLTPTVRDPEGQPTTLAWSLDGAPQAGPIDLAFTQLGSHTLHLVATDPHGASAAADVAVAVVNLPPQATDLQVPATALPGVPFAYSVQATDPDGPAPTVAWAFGGATASGPQGRIALPVGHYDVQVTATDSDGAVVTLERGLDVAPAAQPAAATAQQSAASSAPTAATQRSAQQATAPTTVPTPTAAPPPATAAGQPASSPIAQPAAAGPPGALVAIRHASLALPAVGVAVELAVLLGLLALARRRA